MSFVRFIACITINQCVKNTDNCSTFEIIHGNLYCRKLGHNGKLHFFTEELQLCMKQNRWILRYNFKKFKKQCRKVQLRWNS